MIEYNIEKNLSVEEFKLVLENSTLGQRRPVDDPSRLAKMLLHGKLIVTARSKGKLVGVSRSLTDFAFCTYLSDLAVDLNFQHRGIGKELVRRTKLEAPEAQLIPKIGMSQFSYCYLLDDVADLK